MKKPSSFPGRTGRQDSRRFERDIYSLGWGISAGGFILLPRKDGDGRGSRQGVASQEIEHGAEARSFPGGKDESFVLLSALGGECLEDMKQLRSDKGLGAILAYVPPAPETAQQ